MRKSVASFFLTIAAVASLVGCTSYTGPAKVIDKDYDPGGMRYEYAPCDTKPGTYCYGFHYHSDEWTISVEFTDPEENKVERESYEVDEEQYNSVKVGQQIQLQNGNPAI